MKRFFLSVSCLSLLCACQCNCKGTKSNSSTQIEPTKTPVIAQEVSVPSQQQTTQTLQAPYKTAPIIPLSKETAVPNSAKTSLIQESSSEVTAQFDKEQAQKVIAQDRANQTLAIPPTDKAVFKKEPLLSTEGRLLSPLAYEPILPDNTHAPWSNESLKYGLYYSFIKAGTAYIKTRGLTNVNGKKAYLIQTTAFSASVIDSVFKVRDINYSWLDANTFHSLGYSQSVREGNYKRDEWVTFDNENGRFYGEIQKKEEPKAIAGHLEIEVLDMLSSLYFVRKQPLEVGKDVIFDIINREKQYPLVVKVLRKETVKTEAGKFNCWVVEPQFRGEGIFVAKGKSLKVWLTDDEYRMPVKMSVEVFIGSVYAELLEYQRN